MAGQEGEAGDDHGDEEGVLTHVAAHAATDLGLDCELVKVANTGQITGFGVMMTPALAVDGQVRLAGRVPSLDEALKLL